MRERETVFVFGMGSQQCLWLVPLVGNSYQCLPMICVCRMDQQPELICMVSAKAFSLESNCCIY